MARPVVGVLASSGLEIARELKEEQTRLLATPHGAPSASPIAGRFAGLAVIVIARHGREHRIPPHRINHRANLWALRELGASHVLAASSTGSLKKTIRPGTFVVPHDFVGFWNVPTFHDDRVLHATPTLDEDLRAVLTKAGRKQGATVRSRGIYVQATGPRLETRAEIAHFRTLGDVLGMTMSSEATLASELGLRYASLCSVDNYCNGIVERPLTYEAIAKMQDRNAATVRAIMLRALEAMP